MKIRTITCHDVYNYGASLQAYALQTYLEKEGHDVLIIDYIPSYLKNRRPFWYLNKSSTYYTRLKKNPILRLAYSINNYISYYKKAKRRECFDQFTRKYLKLTVRYTNIEDLRKNPPISDMYIVGSDQVWNSFMNNGKDDAFYLNFGDEKVKRCSYAASFGTSKINEKYKEYTRNMISKLDLISVRESSGVEILKELGFNDVHHVLDPVFLLAKQDWQSIIDGSTVKIDRPYFVIYAIAGLSPEFQEFALKLKQKYNLAIVSIHGVHVKFADYNLSAAGPCEFLNLISKAEYVLSDSFHATAFSTIFNRPFFVFPKSTLNHSARMVDFCNMLGVSCAYNPTISSLEVNKYDWTVINKIIRTKQDYSKTFIQRCLMLV